jgi:uncharacterized lipoprotein YddW (UPF0748 family)
MSLLSRPLNHWWFVTVIFTVVAGCSSSNVRPTGDTRTLVDPPDFPREYRAAWVATATNIDWPSKRGLSAGDQKHEIDLILDRAEALKLNVLMLQVRSAANRIYTSTLPNAEPWSRSVTKDGKLGGEMEDGYDPLKEWVDRAHARGIELHAWINPFRANAATTHPTTVPIGREGSFDPGARDVQDWNKQIVQEFLMPETRAAAAPDVDGVNDDHYFYTDPDDEGGGGTTEPASRSSPWDAHDKETYNRHHKPGESREDFRRRQIDEFISSTHEAIQNSEKPWIKFGVSPKGIFLPGEVHGNHKDQYDGNFANPKKWLNNGWCDYLVPELYWKLDNPDWGFDRLLKWWRGQNSKKRHILAGMNTTKVAWPWEDSKTQWSPTEIAWQIKHTRPANKKDRGDAAHFSMRALTQNRSGIADLLIREVYAEPALVPDVRWKKGANTPAQPTNLKVARLSAAEMPAPKQPAALPDSPTSKPADLKTLKRFYALKTPPPPQVAGCQVKWESGNAEKVWLWTVYARQGRVWTYHIVPAVAGTVAYIPDGGDGPTNEIAVAAVNRYGIESKRSLKEVR